MTTANDIDLTPPRDTLSAHEQRWLYENFARIQEILLAGGAGGDMLRAVYDVDLNGVVDLASFATPLAHAPTHKLGGTDSIKLNEFANPTSSVQFSQQQALQFVVENRTSDPGTPVAGQLWIRTDL